MLVQRREKREIKPLVRYRDSVYSKPVGPMAGEGKALRDIPEIAKNLKPLKKADTRSIYLHRLFYGTKGVLETRKAFLLAFNGIAGKTAEETEQIEKRREAFLERQSTRTLLETCRLLCLPAAAKVYKQKERYIGQIVKFLRKPGDRVVVTEKKDVPEVDDSDGSSLSDEVVPATPKAKKAKAERTEDKKAAKTKTAKAKPKPTKAATPKKAAKPAAVKSKRRLRSSSKK